jgi:hypothetical protein
MSKFFLHQVFANHRIPDPDGYEFQTLNDARSEALAAAREITGGSLRAGKGLVSIDFEIVDEAGNILSVVPFIKVLEPV